jgi:hypothetical protein
MKALTLRQPWARCITHHGKRVENRTWHPPRSLVGQDFAIHAGKTLEKMALAELREDGLGIAEDMPFGAVVAVARLARVVRGWVIQNGRFVAFKGADGVPIAVPVGVVDWFAAPMPKGFGWVLEGIRVLPEPVACNGRQGVWTLPDDVAFEVGVQLGGAELLDDAGASPW